MNWKNYRDLSSPNSDVSAGFQFEFFCENCAATWKSPFKPYRAQQITALIQKIAMMFGGIMFSLGKFRSLFSDIYRVSSAGSTAASYGASKPHQTALAEALAGANTRYHRCPSCKHAVGDECWNDNEEECNSCVAERQKGRGGAQASGGSAMACSNCQTPSQGGRFCHECGFDMASTHKSCPGCGVTLPRAARFCTDCGHGF